MTEELSLNTGIKRKVVKNHVILTDSKLILTYSNFGTLKSKAGICPRSNWRIKIEWTDS